ncbi:hypothetical protein PUV54_06415 [Hyphococcus flavus]|uniref:Uncharacterized protein n=1 Tax=Hyphococcus flavus TaxID=1866326 RepID=A0AAE9ZDA1_9PROT|nr:hypothetical protein [Hyphococcus flavus]WDI32829.1 hypothetical protein PUV54_06415 [Hyphococcus flavus]
MMRYIIYFIAVSYAFNGLFMLIEPRLWYDTIPGVPMLGPYNTHFVRDIGILYLVTAGGFVWGLRPAQNSVLLFACVWPALHAIYHFNMWIGRGFAIDDVAAVNAIAIQAPAWLALYAAWRLGKAR